MHQLYNEHAAELQRYALRLTDNHMHAEDVVQETLLRAWQHPEVTNEVGGSVRAWLFAVARNMIIDYRRSSRFRMEKVDSLEALGNREPVGPDEVNTTLDRLMIDDALAQLPAVHLAVVGRSYYLGWTTAHIAGDLRIAEGTVKSRRHCAVRTLRLIMQEMGITR